MSDPSFVYEMRSFPCDEEAHTEEPEAGVTTSSPPLSSIPSAIFTVADEEYETSTNPLKKARISLNEAVSHTEESVITQVSYYFRQCV